MEHQFIMLIKSATASIQSWPSRTFSQGSPVNLSLRLFSLPCEGLSSRLAELNEGKSRVAAELKLFIIDVSEMGLDEDTTDFITDRATHLISMLDGADKGRELDKIESDLGRLQIVVRQALRRKNDSPDVV